MTQANYLLTAGTLFWVALLVLFAGMSFSMSVGSQAALVVTLVLTAVLVVLTYVLALKGMDRFGRHGIRSTERRHAEGS